MSGNATVRWGWLKFMYVYTMIGAGGTGLVMLVAPDVITSITGWPVDEPIAFGIAGSVYLGFGILSIFGLRSPLKFAPVLFLQLCYKSIWFIGVVLPLLITGHFPGYAVLTAAVFATYITGDLIAIPFSYIFARQSDQ
jgi:hypothetical protein